MQLILFSLLGIGLGLAVFGEGGKSDQGEKEKELRRQFPIYPSNEKNVLIQILQQNIIAYGLPASAFITTTGGADGVFGSGTKSALRWFGYSSEQITFDEYVALSKKLSKGFQLSDLLS